MTISKYRGISIHHIFKDEYSAVSRIMKSYTVMLALCFVVLVMTQQATSGPIPEPSKNGGGGGGSHHGSHGNHGNHGYPHKKPNIHPIGRPIGHPSHGGHH